MTGTIYLKRGNEFISMRNEEYDSESLLQGLLESHPDLLAGEQIDSTTPLRWLLVKREARVPDSAAGASRWAIDHLFVDQSGVPTIVEVKRSTDTRIRREVVGQMLDYAANAVAYFPISHIRNSFEETCAEAGRDAIEHLVSFLELPPDDDPIPEIEKWWGLVQTNLRIGKIRMIFVADVIPQELKRIVEFLNEQTNPAEVLAIEVKQYVSQAQKVFVPRVIGLTAEAQEKKGMVRQGRPINQLLQAISQKFNTLGLPLKANTSPRAHFMQLKTGMPKHIHYEWLLRSDSLECAVHFEDNDRQLNERNLQALLAHQNDIQDGCKFGFSGQMLDKWGTARFTIPIGQNDQEFLANEASACMKHLVEKTYDLLKV